MDFVKLTGIFECKIFQDGKLINEYSDKNLVVTTGLNKLADIFLTDGYLSLNIIKFGSSSTSPTIADTNLTAPIFSKGISSRAIGTPNAVTFNWSLFSGENNGNTIREFGLYFSDGSTLFARKVGVTVAKTTAITMTGAWTLTFN